MAKMYFNKYEPELCYPMDHHIDYMKMEDLPEIIITEAKIDTGSGHFYCKQHNFVGDRSEGGCGKICQQYSPRNGKNGRCNFSAPCYDKTDKKITILNPKYNPVHTFKKGDKVIWDSGYGYDIGYFEKKKGVLYNTCQIKTASGIIHGKSISVCAAKVKPFSDQLLNELTQKYGYQKKFKE